jgi:hypothetical protein
MQHFTFEPVNPESSTRHKVYFTSPDNAIKELLGTVWESADTGWTADFTTSDAQDIGVPGFVDKETAANFLYWYAPPIQSVRSRPHGRANPATATDTPATSDVPVCACCIDNDCACEGTRQRASHTGAEINAATRPSLIPAHSVLFSLVKVGDGYLVDMNTRGLGTGIGYLQEIDDSTYSVRLNREKVGRATNVEAGMWAVIQLHTGTPRYARLINGFETTTQDAPSQADNQP